MELNDTNDDWVAFNDDASSFGFEASVRAPKTSARNSHRHSRKEHGGKSSKDDTISVATWMKKPIKPDASWAPLSPPRAKGHPILARKKRAPDASKASAGSRDDMNPASSSSESSSSERQSRSASRARSPPRRDDSRIKPSAPLSIDVKESRDKSSRGRSRTKGPTKPPSKHYQGEPSPVVVVRGRSMSQTRSSQRGRSSSTSRHDKVRAPETKLRDRSRPPVTSPRLNGRYPEGHSGRRSRSTSRNPPTSRHRSVSRARSNNLPPPRNPVNCSNSLGMGCTGPSQRRPSSSCSVQSFRSADPNIGRDISFGRAQSDAASTSSAKKRSNFMEKLFGDQVSSDAKQGFLPRPNTSSQVWQQPERIHSRILLTATVYHNTATNLWIATINTNQKGVAKNPAKASRYLKAFSFSTEKEARESAIANAPPKMMKFDENSTCYICQGKFAMFRRACHCRNCGVCVCSACSTSWPAKAIPETYNLKKESQVKICKSCNFLSGCFKRALLEGDYEEAIALYGSGNINLRTPFPQFSNKKEEIMYPIHCAVEGGNLSNIRWLMEDHYCPIKVVHTGGGVKRNKKGTNQDYPIVTSRNRSVLAIAKDSLHVKVLRYLVVDCGVSVYESKDLKGTLRALEAALNALPSSLGEYRSDGFAHRWDNDVYDEGTSVASSLGADGTFAGSEYEGSMTNRNEADKVS